MSLDPEILKRYKRVFKLRVKSNLTRIQMATVIQEHFNNQKVSKADVIQRFLSTVKKQKHAGVINSDSESSK